MENEKRHTAVHEAGHAVIGRVVGQVCGYATIAVDEEDEAAGHGIIGDPYETLAAWEKDGKYRGGSFHETMISIVRGRIMCFMAGAEAEAVILGKCEGGDGDDCLQIAYLFADFAVARGADADEYPTRYDDRLRSRVRWLVRRHRDAVERVAELLLERETLHPEDIERAMAACANPV